MPPYATGRLLPADQAPPFLAVVALAFVLTVVVVACDVWQGYAQRRWDRRKAARQVKNQTINMSRTEIVFAPDTLPTAQQDHAHRAALLRVRYAGRGRR